LSFLLAERDGAVTLDILVQPRASRERIGPLVADRLKVSVTAAPTDDQANQAVIELIARSLGVARSAVEIVRGRTARRKTLRIRGIAGAQVRALMEGSR
jgi:uncharacterized protein (TIGR00251 family)